MPIRRFFYILVFAVAAATAHADPPGPAPEGMAWIPSGEFIMGSEQAEARPDEGPPHPVHLDGFWIDVTEVHERSVSGLCGIDGLRHDGGKGAGPYRAYGAAAARHAAAAAGNSRARRPSFQ